MRYGRYKKKILFLWFTSMICHRSIVGCQREKKMWITYHVRVIGEAILALSCSVSTADLHLSILPLYRCCVFMRYQIALSSGHVRGIPERKCESGAIRLFPSISFVWSICPSFFCVCMCVCFLFFLSCCLCDDPASSVKRDSTTKVNGKTWLASITSCALAFILNHYRFTFGV